MRNDIEVMGEMVPGGTLPEDEVRAIEVPTLVLAGDASPAFFRDTAARIAGILRDGRLQILQGERHEPTPEVVAAAVRGFLSRAAQRPARHFGSSPLVACAVTLQERNDAEVLFLGRVKPRNFSIAAWATVMRFRGAAARVITNREASAMARTTTEGSEESER